MPYDTFKLKSGYGNFAVEQETALMKMQNLVKNLSWKGKKNILPFERGILCGINSLKSLFEDLKDCGFKYILTARLNQDSVENLFSSLRRLGGTNNNPDLLQALQRAKMVILSKDEKGIIPVSKPSVEIEQCPYVTSVLDKTYTSTVQETTTDDTFQEVIDKTFQKVKKYATRNTNYCYEQGLNYVAGFLCYKLGGLKNT